MKRLVRIAIPSVMVLSAAAWGLGTLQADASTADAEVAFAFNASSGTVATDSSPNGRHGTVVSATWTTPGRYGNALSFNGTSSRVTTAATLPAGTAFSVTAWVYNPGNSAYETIAAVGAARDVFLRNGRLSVFGGVTETDLNRVVPTRRWVHVAVVSDGTTVRGYLDGTAAAPVATTLATSAAAPLQVGAWPSGSGNGDWFNGRIDEVRWYNRALTAGEVAADLATPITGGPPPTTTTSTTTTTTVPTTTTTVPTTTTTTVPPTTTTIPPGTGSSLRFFGNGNGGIDRVVIPLTPARTIDVGGNFTLEWWMKVAGPLVPGTCYPSESAWIFGNILLDRDVYGGGDYGDYGVSLFGPGGTVAFGVTRGSSGVTACSTVGVADGAWHHIALTRSSTSGTLTIYVDGQPRGTAAGPTGDISYRDARTTLYPADPFLVIGAEKHDGGAEFPSYPGWIDELRVSSVVRYTAAFTPTLAPLAHDASTVALYHADEGSGTTLGDATGANPGTLQVGGTPTGPVWSTDRPF